MVKQCCKILRIHIELEINMHQLRGNAIPAGPLSDFFFTKLGAVEGVPGPYPHAKLHGRGFKNVGL